MHPQVSSMRDLARRAPGLAEIMARRSARAGRARELGFDVLVPLVVADVREHGVHVMPTAQVHITAWVSTNPDATLPAAEELVRESAPDLLVTLELRAATWWARARGAWRVAVDRWGRWREAKRRA